MLDSTARPTLVLCALCLLMMAGRDAPAQSNRHPREYPVQPFAVTETEGEIGTEYNYFGESIRRDGSGTTRYSNNYFQEYIETKARGYFYHPRFIDYSASVKLGLSHAQLSHRSPTTGDRDTNETERLLGYNFRFDILKDNKVSGTVSTQRDERMLMGLFLDRYRVLTESHSATMRYRTRDLRTDLTGTHTETEEDGFNSSGKSTSDTLLYNLAHDYGRHVRSTVRYRLQHYEREFQTRAAREDYTRRNETVTQDLNANNRITFDDAEKLSLASAFTFHDREGREGSQDLRTFFLEETLRYRASRLARPYLKASARRNEYEAREVDTYRGEAGVDGNLYESLAYHFDFSGQRTEHNNFTEDRYGPTGRLDYRKRTDLGVLTAGYSRSLEQVERTSMAGTQDILGERHTLRSGTPSYLRQPDAMPGSLRVADTQNQVVYREGFDYEIVVQGSRVGLRLLPGGLLAEGDAVLVDYKVTTEASQSYLADDENITVRHDFDRGIKGLSLYARQQKYRTHNESPSGDFAGQEHTTRMAGVRQQWRELAYTSEYETYDDDPGGYHRWLNQVEGDHAMGRNLRWGWNAGIIRADYDTDGAREEDERSTHRFAGTNLNGTFARSGFWRVEARVMEDTGRTERTTKGIVARIGYQWRRLKLEAGARFEQYDVPDYEHDRVQLFTSAKLSLGRRQHGKAKP